MTVVEAVRVLSDAGVPSPEHDARVLARHAETAGTDFDELVRRRASREPLQHLVGSVGFRYIELLVGPGVFVPRPETELLVDVVLGELRRITTGVPIVVDLCAGSGALGLSIARERANAVVHLVELDPVAFDWLARNADHTGLDVVVHLADAVTALPELDGGVDVVVSNPPYLPDDDRDALEPEVVAHDPALALFAEDGGLAVIRDVVATARRLLRPGGVLVVEHADHQGEAVPALLESGGWVEVVDHADLAGRPRFTTARLDRETRPGDAPTMRLTP
jgi:release factor glutamine methyltransferase